MMQLDNFRIPGKKLLVKGNLEMRTEDIAGETSGTDLVEKGIKPKLLRVTVSIPYADQQGLRDLVKTAESKNETGEQKIFTITNRTANAAGIRQVRFTEHFNWDEAETLQMWNVSFTLQEYMSNPERVEKRLDQDTSTNTATQYQQVLEQADKL